jgi:hypothetical protein
LNRFFILLCLLALYGPPIFAQEGPANVQPGATPDIREDQTRLKLQRGDFVVVPIPISNPTLDTGLVAGAAYFYPQTESQMQSQPASVTAAAGMYTSNKSRAAAVLQQNYWKEDTWRFTAAAGVADLRLSLLAPDDTSNGTSVDWRINGGFMFARIARRLGGDWYGGILTRLVDASQTIETDVSGLDFDTGSDVRSVGAGLNLEYDSRDMPINSYRGKHLTFEALFNDEAIGSNTSYQSYSAVFRSYHGLKDSLVLAWELQACKRGGTAPLWDACMIKLRGLSVTDYLGKVSASGQLEARWARPSNHSARRWPPGPVQRF